MILAVEEKVLADEKLGHVARVDLHKVGRSRM